MHQIPGSVNYSLGHKKVYELDETNAGDKYVGPVCYLLIDYIMYLLPMNSKVNEDLPRYRFALQKYDKFLGSWTT